MSGVHRREFVLVSPMVDVVHQFSLRSLGRCSLTKTAGLGRYKDAASGLNRLRNSGNATIAPQGDPSNHNFTDHEYPPVLQRTPPRFWPTMQFFRRIAQQIPPRANAPHPPSAFRVVSICEPFRLICRLMAFEPARRAAEAAMLKRRT